MVSLKKLIASFAVLLAVCGAFSVQAGELAISEDFESFVPGPGNGQGEWTSSAPANFSVVDTGLTRFGNRSISYDAVDPALAFDTGIESPTFPGCFDCTLSVDVMITGDSFVYDIGSRDLGGGIQNTVVRFQTNGEIDIFQIVPALFTATFAKSTGHWTPDVPMRIGITVESGGALIISQDGTVIFEGQDMAQAFPFGSADTGIGQFFVNRHGVGSDASIIVDNVGEDMVAASK